VLRNGGDHSREVVRILQHASIVLSDLGPAEFRFRIRFFEDGSGVPGRKITQQEVTARVRNTGVGMRPNSLGKPAVPRLLFTPTEQ
jgi:hypothetical protein